MERLMNGWMYRDIQKDVPIDEYMAKYPKWFIICVLMGLHFWHIKPYMQAKRIHSTEIH